MPRKSRYDVMRRRLYPIRTVDRGSIPEGPDGDVVDLSDVPVERIEAEVTRRLNDMASPGWWSG